MSAFLLPLLAGAALGGGGGTTSSSSTSQTANTIAFNPSISIGAGTTFSRTDAQSDPSAVANAVADNTPQQSAAGFEYSTPPGTYDIHALPDESLQAGLPIVPLALAAAGLGALYFLNRSAA